LDQLLAGELARREGTGVILLRDGHDELQMHVQTELEREFVGVNHGGTGRASVGLSASGMAARVLGVMMGLRMYSFINVVVDVWNCVLSVASQGAALNPSWHLTRPSRSGCNPRSLWKADTAFPFIASHTV